MPPLALFARTAERSALVAAIRLATELDALVKSWSFF